MDWKLLALLAMNTMRLATASFEDSAAGGMYPGWAYARRIGLVAVLLWSMAGVDAWGAPPAPDAASNMMALSFDQLLEINVDKVYGASRYEQKVTQAPSSVSLVTRDDIRRQGYRTLADALRSVNGLFIADDRNYSYIGFRGFNRPGDYNSRVLLLVDGHRVNDNIFEQALLGREAILHIDLVERVEVIRGPSSSIYGDNAFFGVINVATRRGGSINGWEASGAGGTPGDYSARVTYGKKFADGPEVLVSGSWFETSGERHLYYPEFDTPADNNGVAVRADDESAAHFISSITWGDFTLSGAWMRRDKNVPTASFGTLFNDGGLVTEDERTYVNLEYDHEMGATLRLIGRAAYDTASYRGNYPYDDGGGRYLNIDKADGEWVSTDWQLNWRIADRHTVIGGVDYRENLRLQQLNFDEGSSAPYLDDNRRTRNVGVFAQADVQLLTNLLLNAGVRFDHYQTFGSTVNPRAGLIYQPLPHTSIKALYGGAFRAPNAYELYYAYPDQAKANPALEAETIRTYELVYERYLAGNLRFSASGYYYRVNDLISQVTDPGDNLLVFENIDEATARGLELELAGKWEHGWQGRLSYALQKTEDASTGSELSNSPRHNVKAGFTAPLIGDRLLAGLELQYVSPVSTVAGPRTDGTLLVNATLFSQNLAPGLELSATIYNLLDDRDGFSASTEHVQISIPQPGRSFRLKLTYRF